MRMPQEEESYLHAFGSKPLQFSERISVEERWARRLGGGARAESSLEEDRQRRVETSNQSAVIRPFCARASNSRREARDLGNGD